MADILLEFLTKELGKTFFVFIILLDYLILKRQ